MDESSPYRRRPLLLPASSTSSSSSSSLHRRRSRSSDSPYYYYYYGERRTRLVSSTTKKKKPQKKNERKTKNKKAEDDDNDPFAKPMTTEEIYSNIGPVAYVVAGTVEIAFRIVLDYVSAFVFAYVGGTITDLPRFVLKNVDSEIRYPFWQEMTKRYGRMHSKSCRWGKSWGEISAAFGGFGAATRVLRGGREDQWNNILSSAAAGAYFARKEGPQAMARGALFYGAIIYLFSGGLSANKDPSLYNDQPLDF